MKITPMNKSHLKEVLYLEKVCFASDAWSLESFLSELNSKYSIYISILDDDEKLSGYAGCRVVFDEAELVNICVAPNYRRNGIGCYMLDYLIELWKAKNVKFAFLEVRVSNIPAIKLYEKYKFNKISVREHYYGDGEDAYVMMLDMNKV